jgi:FolB domain-containing protein
MLGKPRTDRITLDTIPLDIFIGPSEEERSRMQTVHLSLSVGISPRLMKRAARSDSIGDCVDADGLAKMVHQVAEEKERGLLEHLVEDIAAAGLAGFPIKSIEVSVKKVPYRQGTIGGTTVWIERFQPNALQRGITRLRSALRFIIAGK